VVQSDEDTSEGEESVPQLIADLVAALADLELRLKHFRLRQIEFTGDLTLYGFLVSTWEGANAALHLARATDLGAAAYPCVRAAFEAAQDALLLATEPDYSEAGARARVFERLEHSDIKTEMYDAFADTEADEPPQDYSEAIASIRADAAKWEKECPGRGRLLLDALAQFQPAFEASKTMKARHPGHWSRMSRRRMAVEIGRRVNEPDFAQSLIATYAQLSRASHPRFRIESWEKYSGVDGQRRFRRHPRELRIVLGVAALAAQTATMAFDLVKVGELPAPDV
jgi:hypothetical protein